MAEYFLNALDSAKEHVSNAIGSVLNSSIGKQIWSVAEQLKETGTTEDDFADGSGQKNPYENSAAKGVADITGKLGEDSDFAKDMRQRAKQANATITERVFSDEGWDIAVKILICLLCIMFASFSANMVIFHPPIFRFFIFFFIFLNCWFFDTTFFIMAVFYLFYMLTAIYKNSNLKPGEPRNKWIPHLYALLPLRTAKGPDDWGFSWWANILYLVPIPYLTTYFGQGETGIGHQFYKFYEADYVESIKKQIPSWNTVKDTLGVPALMSEFMEHLEAMNVTYRTDASGAAVSTATLPAIMKAEDLFNKYTEAVTNGDKPLRTKVLARLLNLFITDKQTNNDTELISHIEKYVDVLVKESKFEEAEEMSRLLLSVYQSVSGSRTGRGLASKGADEARARLYKVLEKRQKDIATKVNVLDKDIASRKANKLDTKKLEADKAALEKQSVSLNEEVTKLSAKIRFASTMPTYNAQGRDLSKDITGLMGEIKAMVGKMTGGAATATATAAAPAAATASDATGDSPALAAKFKQLNELLDTYEGIDWAEIHSAKENIQRLKALEKVVAKEVKRLEPLQTTSVDILQDFNLKTAELAGIQDSIEHSLKKISEEVGNLYKKAQTYKDLEATLALNKTPICQTEAEKLTTRRQQIETLRSLVSPKDPMTRLDAILKQIPGQGMGSTGVNTQDTVTTVTPVASAAPAPKKRPLPPLVNSAEMTKNTTPQREEGYNNMNIAERSISDRQDILEAAITNAKSVTNPRSQHIARVAKLKRDIAIIKDKTLTASLDAELGNMDRQASLKLYQESQRQQNKPSSTTIPNRLDAPVRQEPTNFLKGLVPSPSVYNEHASAPPPSPPLPSAPTTIPTTIPNRLNAPVRQELANFLKEVVPSPSVHNKHASAPSDPPPLLLSSANEDPAFKGSNALKTQVNTPQVHTRAALQAPAHSANEDPVSNNNNNPRPAPNPSPTPNPRPAPNNNNNPTTVPHVSYYLAGAAPPPSAPPYTEDSASNNTTTVSHASYPMIVDPPPNAPKTLNNVRRASARNPPRTGVNAKSTLGSTTPSPMGFLNLRTPRIETLPFHTASSKQPLPPISPVSKLGSIQS